MKDRKNVFYIKAEKGSFMLADDSYGYSLGKDLERKIKEGEILLNKDKKAVIAFDKNVKGMSFKFMKGFKLALRDYFDKNNIFDYFVLKGNQRITEKFYENYYF